MASSGLDTDTAWLFTLKEAKELAQQHSGGGIRQLYWRLTATLAGPKSSRHEAEMVDYLLATRAAQMFPSEQDSARLAAEECGRALESTVGRLLSAHCGGWPMGVANRRTLSFGGLCGSRPVLIW